MNDLAARLLQKGSPFELQAVESSGRTLRRFRNLPASLNILYKRAAFSGQAHCLHVLGRDFSYGEIFEQSSMLAGTLAQRHGIRAGDRVAVRASNGPQWLAAFIAITAIGAVAVLLPREMTPEHCVQALDMATCVLLVTDETDFSRLAESSGGRPVIRVRAQNPTAATPYFDDLPLASAPVPSFIEIAPEQEALISFTSGSTGAPKGVICTHRAVLSGVMNATLGGALASIRNRVAGPRETGAAARPCSLSLAPFAHVAGYMHLLISAQAAAKTISIGTWDTAVVAQLIEQQRVTSLSGANAETLAALLRAEEYHRHLGSLASVSIHGSSLRATLAAEVRTRLPHTRPATSYGLTETCGPISCGFGNDLLERPESCGAVLPSVDVCVVGENGEALRIGETGEIWVGGSMLMSGYCAAPRETSRALVNGWLRTGDRGFVDSDGFLYVRERVQDLQAWHGGRVSLASLEQVVCGNAAVKDAAVLRMEDVRGRPRLVVAIVPDIEDGNEARSVSLANVTASAGLPCEDVEVIALSCLPRTGIGKIDRRALRELLVNRNH